jgi:flavin-dependent dehydrogenase
VADRSVDVLIVGAGPAGSSCAAGLREAGFGGSVLLAGREPDAP